MTLTDHNTVSPLARMDSLSTDDVLTMGGLELTTYYGHALVLGVRHCIDWRVRAGERTMQDIAARRDTHRVLPATLQPGFNAARLGHLYLSSQPKLKLNATTADGACA